MDSYHTPIAPSPNTFPLEPHPTRSLFFLTVLEVALEGSDLFP
uniref:Uncharacterized protein n=1 Tax=Trichinella nativa TaxID=6335 RepID=A0A0V1KI93_9BILA